jgi:hypothetical protein
MTKLPDLTVFANFSLKSLFEQERRKYLKNLMGSLMRMLQAITNGEDSHIKY